MNKKEIKSIAKRFTLLRDFLTMEEMGLILGVSKQAISRYENALRLPDANSLYQLAKIGVNLHWLLQGEGHKYLNFALWVNAIYLNTTHSATFLCKKYHLQQVFFIKPHNHNGQHTRT